MRIVLIGQQAFGKSVLDAILEAGKDEVVGVFCSPDKEGGREDPLKAGAGERGIPVLPPPLFRINFSSARINGLSHHL